MGGNNRQQQQQQQKKSSSAFAVFNIFKTKKSRKVEDTCDDSMKACKVWWPSDEDRGRWVADPSIDKKATIFIAKIHAATQNVSET